MKIGKFAEKFGVNISTVRFYVNNGLLRPERKNGQYEFGKDCLNDMNNILKYKSYHFSLEEIELLFFLEKTSRFKDDVILDLCSKLMKSKRKELIDEQETLAERIRSLDREIEDLPAAAEDVCEHSGVPFAFIPYLYCPECGVPLKLDSASIAGGFLEEGKLWCDCGYEARIEDGVVICREHYDDSPLKAFENVESVLAFKEQFSPRYRTLIDKAYQYMYEKICSGMDSPQIIMAGPFTFNFLLSYMKKLGSGNSYIIVDPSRKRIEKLRSYLSESGYDIMYITGEVKHIPVKKGIADIYIDDYSTVNAMFIYGSYDTGYIAPFLKNGGRAAGIFNDYRYAQKALHNFVELHPDFKPERMTKSRLKNSWEQHGVRWQEEKSLGFTSEYEHDYAQDMPGEKVEVSGYFAEKRKKHS